jgi:hypothetical protein
MAEVEARVEEVEVRKASRNEDEQEGREEPSKQEVKPAEEAPRPMMHLREIPRRRIPQKELQLRRTVVALMKRQRAVETRLNGMKSRDERTQKRIEDPHGIKRLREEPSAPQDVEPIVEPPTKRLRPQVVVPGAAPVPEAVKLNSEDRHEKDDRRRRDEPLPVVQERKPSAAVPEVKSNKRLFGNLLFGTLKAIKKDAAQEMQNEAVQKRTQLLNSIDEKESKEADKRREERAEWNKEIKTRLEESLVEVNALLSTAKGELKDVRSSHQDWLLSGFLKTTSGPPVYFLPAKIDDFIITQFGYKPRPERKESEDGIEEESEGEEADNEGKEVEEEKEDERQQRQGAVIIEDGLEPLV